MDEEKLVKKVRDISKSHLAERIHYGIMVRYESEMSKYHSEDFRRGLTTMYEVFREEMIDISNLINGGGEYETTYIEPHIIKPTKPSLQKDIEANAKKSDDAFVNLLKDAGKVKVMSVEDFRVAGGEETKINVTMDEASVEEKAIGGVNVDWDRIRNAAVREDAHRCRNCGEINGATFPKRVGDDRLWCFEAKRDGDGICAGKIECGQTEYTGAPHGEVDFYSSEVTDEQYLEAGKLCAERYIDIFRGLLDDIKG